MSNSIKTSYILFTTQKWHRPLPYLHGDCCSRTAHRNSCLLSLELSQLPVHRWDFFAQSSFLLLPGSLPSQAQSPSSVSCPTSLPPSLLSPSSLPPCVRSPCLFPRTSNRLSVSPSWPRPIFLTISFSLDLSPLTSCTNLSLSRSVPYAQPPILHWVPVSLPNRSFFPAPPLKNF